jgi:hypothetical protein
MGNQKSPISKTTNPRQLRVVRDRRIRLVVVLVFQPEKRPPCFGVFTYDLLGGGRTKHVFVFAFETTCIGVPHVLVFEAVLVVVPDDALVATLTVVGATGLETTDNTVPAKAYTSDCIY